MKSKLAGLSLPVPIIVAILAILCATGCATNNENVSNPTNEDNISEAERTIDYDGKPVTFKDVELYIPLDWNVETSDTSLQIVSDDKKSAMVLLVSPIENTPDNHGLVIANNAKLVYTLYCEGNDIAQNAELQYEVVNGYPCYYANHFLYKEKDGSEDDIFASLYVVGFVDHCTIIQATYTDQEQDINDAILSTLTTTERASDAVVAAVSSLDANTNPAQLYNMEQEIIAKAYKEIKAEKDRLKTQEPAIGMTKYEVLNSAWGEPDDKNVTITKYGTHEQWVYSRGRYVYFDNGEVSAIQK